MTKVTIIIVAGGSGTRMGAAIPKQFLKIASKVILMHTIEAFTSVLPQAKIVVALPQEHIAMWEKLCKEHNFDIPHTTCQGGSTRFASVKNALSFALEGEYIAIHDGVRPLVSEAVITNALDKAKQVGSAIPVVMPVSSLRRATEGSSQSVDRTEYREVQTPQVFERELILKAYEQPFSELFTDDASVVETLGHEIGLSQGSYENIKITSKVDLATAEAIILNRCM
ncbi:MAG: 2-C-methyl-D-erythritol 4-phosphate cytidylyltransferase [Rikenellaceae bacterium]